MSAASQAFADLNAAVLAEFGENCTYTAPGGVAVAFVAVVRSGIMSEVGAAANAIRLWTRSASFQTLPARGGVVVRGGATYSVVDVDVEVEGGLSIGIEKQR